VRVSSHHAPRAVNMTHCTRSSGNRNGCSLSEPDSPWLL
jgi:hypothetical protein